MSAGEQDYTSGMIGSGLSDRVGAFQRVTELESELTRLREERDRYRKALKLLEHLPDYVKADSYTDKRSMQDAMDVANYAFEIASEALSGSEGGR